MAIPDWNPEPHTEVAQQPLRLPVIPDPVSRTEGTVTFSSEGLRTLLDLVDVSEGNYTIARENAAALDDMSAAYNQLIETGELYEQFGHIREEQLERSRREHFQDNLFHRGVIFLAIALMVTL